MMGLGPSEVARLTYYQFTAMRGIWNNRHALPPVDGDDGAPVEPPSADFVRERQRELAALGISGTRH